MTGIFWTVSHTTWNGGRCSLNMFKIRKGKIKHVVVYYKWQCFSTSGPREILLELITNLNVILYLSTCHVITHKCTNTLYDYAIIN